MGDPSMWRPGGDPIADLEAMIKQVKAAERARPRLEVSPYLRDDQALVADPIADFREHRVVYISVATAERLKAEHPDDAARWGLT